MQRSAFSLVELSIVLVILGLLTGGILAGQSLIRAAEIRAFGSEWTRWLTATQSFRDKYFAIPGDMTNATAFWGKDNTNCSGNTGTAATPGTCNGTGNGTISWTGTEKHRFWQQLALAGLIEGTYTGLAGPLGAAHVVGGTNAPKSKLSNGVWGLGGEGSCGMGGSPCWFADTVGSGRIYSNYYVFGQEFAGSNNPVNAVLRPEESWNLDTKLDDGMPSNGKLLAVYNAGCVDATSNTDSSATYNLDSTSISCIFFMPNSF